MEKWKSQLRKGLVELCLLAALDREGEAYGYQLLQVLENGEGMSFSESTIYPVLTRLSQNGLLQSRMVASDSGPRRRYYKLSKEGKSRLGQMSEEWRTLSQSLNKIIEG